MTTNNLLNKIDSIGKILEELKTHKKIHLDFRGPRPTFVEKSQNYFGQVMELFAPIPKDQSGQINGGELQSSELQSGELQKVITYLQNKISLNSGARFHVDIDPEHPL